MGPLSIVILAYFITKTEGQCTTSECESGRSCDQRLLALSDQVSSLKRTVDTLSAMLSSEDPKPRDCADIRKLGYTKSGVYTVYYLEGNVWAPVRVYCDMETVGGGWLVFQRRKDGSENFYRNWIDYMNGFGNLNGEFWLGNYYLHVLTSSGNYKLRFDLGDFEGQTRYAEYDTFSVGDPASVYKLRVIGYSGDAGDSFGGHNGHEFSTKDQDNDRYETGQCAVSYKGAWWYTKCHSSNLNGMYLRGNHTSYADGVNWSSWHGQHYSLKITEMKFKPI